MPMPPESAPAPHERWELLEQEARRMVRQALGLLWLRHAVVLGTGWLFAWGLAALVLRLTLAPPGTRLAAIGGAGLLAAGAAGLWPAWRRRPEAQAVMAVLDGAGRCGGLAMASGASPAARAAWGARLPAPGAARLEWRARRPLTGLGLACLFAAGALGLPVTPAAEMKNPGLDMSEPLARVGEQIEMLEEARLLPAEKAEVAKETMEKLRREASGRDPARAWEALDHLRQSLRARGAEAAEETLEAMEALAPARALAEALMEEAGPPEAGWREQARRELGKRIEAAMEKAGAPLREVLDPAWNEALEAEALDRAMDRAQLERLAEATRRAMAERARLMERLEAQALAEEADRARAGQLNELDGASLARLLEAEGEGEPAASISRGVEAWMEQRHWGISQNGGEAPLTRREEASHEEAADFRPILLPEAEAKALAESRLMGLGAAAPEANEAPIETSSGALKGAASGGGSAAGHRVLPRHRAAVRHYFDRDSTAPTEEPR